jgi:hypothetical protein
MSHCDQSSFIATGLLYVSLQSELSYCDRPTVCLLSLRVVTPHIKFAAGKVISANHKQNVYLVQHSQIEKCFKCISRNKITLGTEPTQIHWRVVLFCHHFVPLHSDNINAEFVFVSFTQHGIEIVLSPAYTRES